MIIWQERVVMGDKSNILRYFGLILDWITGFQSIVDTFVSFSQMVFATWPNTIRGDCLASCNLKFNELEDRTKGSENPGSRSFLRILIWIWTALRIGPKDLDPFLPISIQIQILILTFTFHILALLKLH